MFNNKYLSMLMKGKLGTIPDYDTNSVDYISGDVIVYNQTTYKCILPHTSTEEFIEENWRAISGAKVRSFEKRVVIDADTTSVEVGIAEFNPVYDELLVFINSTFINNTGDYAIDGGTIVNEIDEWKAGDIFDFLVIKNVGGTVEYVDGSLIEYGTVGDQQLSNNIKIGSLASLATIDKTSVVSAINENVTQLADKVSSTNITNVRDNTDVFEYSLDGTTWKQVQGGSGVTIDDTTIDATKVWSSNKISSELTSKAPKAEIGNLTTLNTTNKDSVTNAINEVNTGLTSKANSSDLTTTNTNVTNLTNRVGTLETNEFKVKSSATDDSTGFLDAKIDGLTVVVENDVLVVKNIDGLTVGVAQLNMLQGATSNIQAQINSLTSVGNFTGAVDTYADLATTFTNPAVNDMAITITDETKGDISTIYMYDGTSWVYAGAFTATVRDFSTNPLNLATEVTGVLADASIPATIARDSELATHTGDTIKHITSTERTNWDGAVTDKHTHSNKTLLDTYTQTETNLADAVTMKHSHVNGTDLDRLGISVNDILTIDNIEIASNTLIIDWVSGGTYVISQPVQYNGTMYISKTDHTGVTDTPDEDTTNWLSIEANVEKIGDLTTLTTTAKDTLVNAINENTAQLDEYVDIFYNNAGAHNSIYRGKYLGGSVTTEQYQAISSGTFEDLYIGDYWTIGGVNYRIAAFNYYKNTGDTSLTANHVTIVPDTQLYTNVMNDTNITDGGYVGSKMYTEGLTQAKTTINSAFNGHVVNHKQLLCNATIEGEASGWAWFNSEVELMTEIMLYGSSVFGAGNLGGGSGHNIGVGKSQLPLFALNPQLINTRQHYWLRDVVSAAHFALANASGNAASYFASDVLGVRPAFSIS